MANSPKRRGNYGSERRSEEPTEPARQEYIPQGELIAIARVDAGVRATREGVPVAESVNVGPLAEVFSLENINIRPLFGATEERVRHEAAPMIAGGAGLPDMSQFYRVDAPADQLPRLAEMLRTNPAFECAYIKPFAELPLAIEPPPPLAAEPPFATPDFTGRQGYLGPAPGGIEARFAWTIPGGDGRGVGIIDIEGAWRFTHEDLRQLGGVVGGSEIADVSWRNHGSSVLGIMGGAKNAFGVTGICSGANIRAISHQMTGGTSAAIRMAADMLRPGDIILLEAHRPGPAANFQNNNSQSGYIAIEWWPDDLAAIQHAVGRGIIVVGAAGNGAQNLDDPIYDQNPTTFGSSGPFPSSWRNPFRRNPVDSGAVLVGAGAPPSGSFGRDRSRLNFSNFGVAVDTQGWGAGVASTGYGDIQGGSSEDLWYTGAFSGTSSASPIVVGAIACLSGALNAAGSPALTPARARQLLRDTGSPQDGGGGNIGRRPDLRQLFAAANITGGVKTKETKESKETKETKESDVVKTGNQKQESDAVIFKNMIDGLGAPTPAGAGSLADRLASLEAKVDQLSHFIGQDSRPDVGTSALAGEPDLGDDSGSSNLAQLLRKQSAEFKQALEFLDKKKNA